MWAALARYGNRVREIDGGYVISPPTDEERLEGLDHWRLSKSEQWRLQFYRRKRAWAKGLAQLFVLVVRQFYYNVFGRRERHVFRVIIPHKFGEPPCEFDRVVYIQETIP